MGDTDKRFAENSTTTNGINQIETFFISYNQPLIMSNYLQHKKTQVRVVCFFAFVAMKVVTFSSTIKWETQKIRFAGNETTINGIKANRFSR